MIDITVSVMVVDRVEMQVKSPEEDMATYVNRLISSSNYVYSYPYFNQVFGEPLFLLKYNIVAEELNISGEDMSIDVNGDGLKEMVKIGEGGSMGNDGVIIQFKDGTQRIIPFIKSTPMFILKDQNKVYFIHIFFDYATHTGVQGYDIITFNGENVEAERYLYRSEGVKKEIVIEDKKLVDYFDSYIEKIKSPIDSKNGLPIMNGSLETCHGDECHVELNNEDIQYRKTIFHTSNYYNITHVDIQSDNRNFWMYIENALDIRSLVAITFEKEGNQEFAYTLAYEGNGYVARKYIFDHYEFKMVGEVQYNYEYTRDEGEKVRYEDWNPVVSEDT